MEVHKINKYQRFVAEEIGTLADLVRRMPDKQYRSEGEFRMDCNILFAGLHQMEEHINAILGRQEKDMERLRESLDKQIDLNSELSATVEMQHTQIVLLEEAIR